jgi:hypothetical protein
LFFPSASITWFRFLRVDSKSAVLSAGSFSQLPKNYGKYAGLWHIGFAKAVSSIIVVD